MEVSDLIRRYDRPTRSLWCFYRSRATSRFWDENWRAEDLAGIPARDNRWFVEVTRRYLPSGCRVVEGGCGVGDKVYHLDRGGYEAYGVDFAADTIRKTLAMYPDLRLRQADVRHMPFPEGYFDGYWSIGVIEHDPDGYEDIVREMARVVKPGGYLFLTFPFMSGLKKLKAMAGAYELRAPGSAGSHEFFQFELDKDRVIRDLDRHQFSAVRSRAFAEELGVKSDLAGLYAAAPWRRLREYRGRNVVLRGIRWGVSHLLLKPLAGLLGYSVLIVARKRG